MANRNNAAIVADSILLKKKNGLEKDQILLIKRIKEPFIGMWALPGGHIEPDETCIKGAYRENSEETNVQQNDVELDFMTIADTPDRDPRGRVVSFIYKGRLNKEVKIKAGDDAGAVRWFMVDNLPPMAFDHAKIIKENC